MKSKPLEPRNCPQCKKIFLPTKRMQKTCTHWECARDYGRAKQAKKAARAQREDTKVRKAALMTLPERKKLTERACNAYILARDKDLPCISCGAFSGKPQAGHYLSVGARPNLRFVGTNINKQCYRCNCELGGNAVMYRIGLVRKIGLEAVEALESDHEPRHFSHDDLIALAKDYRKKTRELMK